MTQANLTDSTTQRPGRRPAQSTPRRLGAQADWCWAAALFVATFASLARPVAAQSPVATTSAPAVNGARGKAALVRPTSETTDRLRLAELAGDSAHPQFSMLRSPSTVRIDSGGSRARTLALRALWPDVYVITNSALPFSMNDGAMWAGRGANFRVSGGIDVRSGRLHAVVAPEMWVATNARFDHVRDVNKFFTPSAPEPRWGNGFADGWYARPYSADLPWRLGSSALGRGWFGQSGLWYDSGPVELGVTTENMWWGPGVRNAIVMSDNAAGIPRIELRTARPRHTRVGDFEARWFVGALSESQYFDTTKANDVRSIAAAAVSWRPWFQPTLTLGATRAVYATATGYGAVPFRWLDVFANTGHPADHQPSDSSLTPGGRDQLFSLFARWVLPADGFEAYTEWARQELPRSFHDFVVAPTHSHGYTLGLQYRKPAPAKAATFRLQAEATTLEQSSDFKIRPVGVFYTSRRVIQGYTEFGQPIGAAIGPGSSSQWLAWDRVWATGSYGVTFTRIRWNEDVRSNFEWPAYVGACNHDVSLLPGVRGGHTVGGGYVSGELLVGNRLNAFFQNQSGCPTGGPSKVDLHPVTLSISFTPFAL